MFVYLRYNFPTYRYTKIYSALANVPDDLTFLRSLFMKSDGQQQLFIHCHVSCAEKRCLSMYLEFLFYFFLPSSVSSWPRSGVAMPFGCLAIGEKKDYNNPSDVTDKYDLGQIVKSWVSQQSSLDLFRTVFVCSRAQKPSKLCLLGRSSVRFLEPRTEPRWRCTHAKSSWRRMEGRSARLQKMRSSFWRCEESFYLN